MVHSVLEHVADAIRQRSRGSRKRYDDRNQEMRDMGPPRPHLSCGNLAHAYAACGMEEKARLVKDEKLANIGIVSAYNDMLSAHQPYHKILDDVRSYILNTGAVAQMAGGVPAMCDGVTQGQPGMELSLFSRDVIAMSTGVALSHNVFNGGLLFGICDKIVPGMLMGALAFGHLPFVFVPAGPMPTGISNGEKAEVRAKFAKGEVGREELLESESRAYHSPGTCTFYGTANTNQMMLEMMGLQLPGSSFFNPTSPLRPRLNEAAADAVIALARADQPVGIGDMVSERSIINAICGLLATGGSTNHTIHIVAIAAAAGWKVKWADFDALSKVVPLLARVYPNGIADVNAFHAAGGTPWVTGELLDAGLLFGDIDTVLGHGLAPFAEMPEDRDGDLVWARRDESGDDSILRPADNPFQPTGGLQLLEGNLGTGVIKISAVKPEHHIIEAPAIVFESQDDMLDAYKAGGLEKDFVAVIRFQGPRANGMPELHKLTPSLGVLQDKGFRVALVTDGRMSGASGKVPAAIHISPEAAMDGPLARVQTGDLVRLDAPAGKLEVLVAADAYAARTPANKPRILDTVGRSLFGGFRSAVTTADAGGTVIPFFDEEA